MSFWQLHPLNARHGLTPVLPELRAAVREAVALASGHVVLPSFDLVVRSQPGGVSEPDSVAHVPTIGLIEITLDPDRWAPDAFVRSLIRQFHHLLRRDNAGAPRSLGDALVAEGLAGHFVTDVLGGPVDPWDAATPSPAALRRAISDWARPGFDQGVWFAGRGDLRRWTGYGLGHRLVAAYLDRHPEASAVALANIRTDEFRPVLRSLISAMGEDEADMDPDAITPADAGTEARPAHDSGTGDAAAAVPTPDAATADDSGDVDETGNAAPATPDRAAPARS